MDKQNNSNLSVLSHSLQIRISQRKRRDMPHHFKYQIIIMHQSNQPCRYQYSRIYNRKSTAATSASDLLQIKLSIKTLTSLLQTLYSIVGFNYTVKAQVRKYFTMECVTNTILSLRNPRFPVCLAVIGLYFIIHG